MAKVAIFACSGDLMHFAHAMMNALDMHSRGIDVKLLMDCGALRLVAALQEADKPFAELLQKVRETGILGGVCMACAERLKITDEVRRQGLPMQNEMFGHPSMGHYIQEGYQIIVI